MSDTFDIPVTLRFNVKRLSETALAVTSPLVPSIFVGCRDYDEAVIGVQTSIRNMEDFMRTEAAVKAEREACAKIAEKYETYAGAPQDAAREIRARSNCQE